MTVRYEITISVVSMVEAEVELRRVRQEMGAVLGRLARGLNSEDRDQYVRLLAREELLTIELNRISAGDGGRSDPV